MPVDRLLPAVAADGPCLIVIMVVISVCVEASGKDGVAHERRLCPRQLYRLKNRSKCDDVRTSEYRYHIYWCIRRKHIGWQRGMLLLVVRSIYRYSTVYCIVYSTVQYTVLYSITC